jgi:hypothetical protein
MKTTSTIIAHELSIKQVSGYLYPPKEEEVALFSSFFRKDRNVFLYHFFYLFQFFSSTNDSIVEVQIYPYFVSSIFLANSISSKVATTSKSKTKVLLLGKTYRMTPHFNHIQQFLQEMLNDDDVLSSFPIHCILCFPTRSFSDSLFIEMNRANSDWKDQLMSQLKAYITWQISIPKDSLSIDLYQQFCYLQSQQSSISRNKSNINPILIDVRDSSYDLQGMFSLSFSLH